MTKKPSSKLKLPPNIAAAARKMRRLRANQPRVTAQQAYDQCRAVERRAAAQGQ